MPATFQQPEDLALLHLDILDTLSLCGSASHSEHTAIPGLVCLASLGPNLTIISLHDSCRCIDNDGPDSTPELLRDQGRMPAIIYHPFHRRLDFLSYVISLAQC